MKKTLIVLLILVSVMLTGCGSRSADSAAGKYKFNRGEVRNEDFTGGRYAL